MDRAGEGRRRRDIEYASLPSQARFHQSKTRFKGFSGPIGSGKSQALCHEAIKLSYLNPGRTGLIGAPTYPMLRDSTQATLLEILDSNAIPYDLNKAENILRLKDTRSKILLRAVDDFERLRGTNLAWFGLDELTYTSEEAWLRLEGRLRDPKASRLCGFAVWTPKGHDWVYRRFLAEPVEGYQAVVAPPFENSFLLKKVPDFYQRLERSYDERFYRQEVLGEYLSIENGLVYHAFDRKTHIREVELQAGKPLLWALDFNVDPMSSVVVQTDGEDVHVVDEIVIRRASTRDACEEFHNRFSGHTAGIVVYGDASGNWLQTTGMSDFQIIRDYFGRRGEARVAYRVPGANPAVRERVALVNAKLKNALGESHLFASRRCKELIKDFEEVSYKPESSVIDKEKDAKRTHLSDALGYLIWQEFGPKQRIGEKRLRLL